MRLEVLPDLDVGDTTDRYRAYVPEPIEPEITEVLHRVDPRLGSNSDAASEDDEPPPLPPVPKGLPQSYPIASIAVIKRVLAPREAPVPPRRRQSFTPAEGITIYPARLRAIR